MLIKLNPPKFLKTSHEKFLDFGENFGKILSKFGGT